MRHLVWLFLCMGLVGCGDSDDTAEIELWVDTQIDEVDAIRVVVTHPSGETSRSRADLAMVSGPRRLRLRHVSGPLGPVAIDVAGLVGDTERVEVRRTVDFERGRTLRVEVVLVDACVGLDCGERTCGNDGTCRAPQLRECELAVGGCAPTLVDAGPADAGPFDSGTPDAGDDGGGRDAAPVDAAPDAPGCDGFAVCGVSALHLPGDELRPRPCADRLETTAEVWFDEAPLTMVDGAVLVVRPGAYLARLASASCTAEMRFTVAGPTGYDLSDTYSEMRELSGRVDSAVVVRTDGANHLTRSGSSRLVGEGAAGDVHRNLRAVAYTSTGAWIAADGAHDRYIHVGTPLGTSTPMAFPLTDDLRSADRLEHPVGADVPVLFVSDRGVGQLNAPGDEGHVLSDHYFTWAAVGTSAEEGRGAVWAGDSGQVYNLALDGRSTAFETRGVASIASDNTPVRAAAVDESAGVTSLWLCGRELWRYDLTGDLRALDALPAPAATVDLDCTDLALGDDGELWVLTDGEVVRLSRDGNERVRFGEPQGLFGRPVMQRLDFASDATGRSLWLMSSTEFAVMRFSADPLAP